MNSIRVRIGAGALLIAFLTVPAAAVDFTAFVGGVKPGKLTVEDVRTSFDSNPIFGFRLNTNFVPLIGLEHTIAFTSDFLIPRNLPNAIRDADGFVYSSNLMLNIPVGGAVPYVTAGIGILRQYGSDDLHPETRGTKFAFNYGGGVKLPRLLGPLGLRFDARGYRASDVFSKTLNLIEVSGGILLSF
jgi:hypothetical protein